MNVIINKSKEHLGEISARDGAEQIIKAIEEKGHANIIVATGSSQFLTLKHLGSLENIPWPQVTIFHLDEYIGINDNHSASFRNYIHERLLNKIDPKVTFIDIRGENPDSQMECKRLNSMMNSIQIDVAFIGIGENGHIAFNDPPADFQTTDPYIVVSLDEACRNQQVDEGWFDSLQDVPETAISMSICQIMKSKVIICSVPDSRKALVVKHAVEGKVTNSCPASILQNHDSCILYLDPDSASLLHRT